jgi:hypothetical protein
LDDFWAFLGNFVQIGFSGKRAIVGRAMPRRGTKKFIHHEEHEGHEENKG